MEEKGEVWSAATFLPQTRHFTPSPKAASENIGHEFMSKKDRQRLERQQQREKELELKKALAAERAEKEKEVLIEQKLKAEVKAAEELASAPVDTESNREVTEVQSRFEELSVQQGSQEVQSPLVVAPAQSSSSSSTFTDQMAEYRKQQAAARSQAKSGAAAKQTATAAPTPIAKVTGGVGKVGVAPKKKPSSTHQPPVPQKLPPNEKDKLVREAANDDELLDAIIKNSYVRCTSFFISLIVLTILVCSFHSGICHFPGCKENVKLIHSDCHYCLERFCMKHALAEVHGCGDLARSAARRETVSKAKEIKATGGKSLQGNANLKDWQRSSLQGRLQKKIDEQKSDRTRQAPKSDKAKK
jgi:hypothetical protein